MIRIKKSTLLELIKTKKHESCGVVHGIDNNFMYNYKAINLEKRKNKFRIGTIDKLKIILDMIKKDSNCYALYHVHNSNLKMSSDDIKNAKVGSYNIIICGDEVAFYYIMKKEDKKIAASVNTQTI